MRFFRRIRDLVVKPEAPPKCPACDSRLALEPLGHDRFLCPGCAKDFRAVRQPDGCWTYDTTPLRYQQRRLSA